MTFELYRDDDEHVAARLAAGSPVSAIVSDDPVERASRLDAVMAKAAATGIRVYRVGNGLRAPLTLPRIAFQLANRGNADNIAPSSPPEGRSILIIEQAETLAPDALSAMRGMGVQLLLVGSSALPSMLVAVGGEPSKSAAGGQPALLNARVSALQDEYEHGRIDDPAWALDWDDEPRAEHAASHAAFETDDPPPPVLRAAPRPYSDRPRAGRGPLWVAVAATVAIVIAATTLSKPASVRPTPADQPRTAMLNAAAAPHAAEQASLAPLPQATHPARSVDPPEVRQPSATSTPGGPTASAPGASQVASSVAPGFAPSPSDSAPANAAAPPPTDPASKLRRQFETFLQLPENRGRRFSADTKEALFAQFKSWRAQQATAAVPGPGLAHAARIVLHVPRAAPPDGPGGVRRFIEVLGPLGTVQTRIVDEQPGAPSVRYFYREDAAAARQVATALDGAEPGWQPRDFTSYRPKPVAGTIEVWLPQR